MKNKAVFLDKDGTLVEDVPYNVDPSKVEWQPGCFNLLRKLSAANYLLVIITNQPGLALGLFDKASLRRLEQHIRKSFLEQNVTLAGFYYCPHLETGSVTEYANTCTCRKPGSALFYQAANDLEIDLSASWMIGDILNDIEAGNKAGCRTILINNGNETEWQPGAGRRPTHIVPTIYDAAKYILHEKHLMHPGR